MSKSDVALNEALEHVNGQVGLKPSYFVLMTMAGVLSAVALLTNSVPILIGSMVVAPALPPFALIAFALVSRQLPLARRGLWTGLLGLIAALVAATFTTWLLDITGVIPKETHLLEKPLLEERVRWGWYSAIAGLAAGIAGTLALIDQKVDTLVGVVASLALVPVVGAIGIALLSSDASRSFGGLVLLSINVVLIVVAGVLTLLVMRVART